MATWGKNTFSGNNDRAPRLDELVEVLELPDNEWVTVRPIGPTAVHAEHWIKIQKRDGGTANIWKQCLNYDAASDSFDTSRGCPYCEGLGKPGKKVFLGNAIVRDLQDSRPKRIHEPTEKELKRRKIQYCDSDEPVGVRIIEKGSKTWTPVRVIKAGGGLAGKLADLTKLNKIKGEVYELTDKDHGRDVLVMKKVGKNISPADMYQVQRDERTPLTEEERGYLQWRLDLLVPETREAAEAEWSRFEANIIHEEGKGGGVKRGKENRRRDEDEDEDYYSSKGRHKVGGKRPAADDEDDEPPKRKKRRVEEDDDDEEPPAKRRRRAADDDDDDDAPATKRRRARDDDDDMEDVEDDDEDDVPPRRRRR
jgi:hypothetical protein